MRKLRRMKPRGIKRVSYQLIEPDSEAGKGMYRQLRDMIRTRREDLSEARIALAWCTSWKPNVDGFLTLGKCKKATDLDRELAALDFVILLYKRWWQDVLVPAEHREAVLFHELCHAAVTLDKTTHEPVRDERGRLVYRLRKHDIEEFSDVVRTYGYHYRQNLEAFAKEILAKQEAPWTPCDACRESPGFVAVVENGVPKMARCACWTRKQEALAS